MENSQVTNKWKFGKKSAITFLVLWVAWLLSLGILIYSAWNSYHNPFYVGGGQCQSGLFDADYYSCSFSQFYWQFGVYSLKTWTLIGIAILLLVSMVIRFVWVMFRGRGQAKILT